MEAHHIVQVRYRDPTHQFQYTENPEPNNRWQATPVQKSTTYQGHDCSTTVVPWGKSPTKNQLVAGAFQDNHICPEKWVLSGQVYILERPHPPKKLPHYYDDPTKGSLEIGAERVRKRVGKNSGREIHTRENSEELEERSNSPLSRGLLGGYTKRGRRIRAGP